MNGEDTRPDSTSRGTMQREVLGCERVVLHRRDETSIVLLGFDLSVRAGTWCCLPLESHQDPRDVAAMMVGVVRPDGGVVRVAGRDWASVNYPTEFAMRARIRRIYAEQAWIENLTIAENITWPAVHHGRDEKSVVEEVMRIKATLTANSRNAELARRLAKGWKSRPAFVEPSVSQIFQWIRALLGQPQLIIAERPLDHLTPAMTETVLEQAHRFRQASGSMVWLSPKRRCGDLMETHAVQLASWGTSA